MADNVDISPGSGKTIATDDISDVQYQRMKLVHGVDGTNDGDVSKINPFPVREGCAENMLAEKKIAFTSFPSSFTDAAIGTITGYTKVRVWNDLDANVTFSWDAGSTTHGTIPAKSSVTLRIKASATALHHKYESGAPTAGNIYYWPEK